MEKGMNTSHLGATAVLIPAYQRPEYTEICLRSVVDAQDYSKNVIFFIVDEGGNKDVIREFSPKGSVIVSHSEPAGLRNTIIEFFHWVLEHPEIQYITKIDNDCAVPKNWLHDLTEIFEEADADILSPDTSETRAAHKYGFVNRRSGRFIPSRIVGGLWFMKRAMIEDIYFESVGVTGIRAAFHLINQIITEKSPKIGWTDAVKYEDIGYWTGSHPKHIKSIAHAVYAAEVGRPITWQPEHGKEDRNAEEVHEEKSNANAPSTDER